MYWHWFILSIVQKVWQTDSDGTKFWCPGRRMYLQKYKRTISNSNSKHAYYTKSQTFSHLHVFSLNLNKKWCLETWENSLLALRIDLPTYIIDGEKNSSCCSQNLSVVKNILEAYDPEKMPSFLLIWLLSILNSWSIW